MGFVHWRGWPRSPSIEQRFPKRRDLLRGAGASAITFTGLAQGWRLRKRAGIGGISFQAATAANVRWWFLRFGVWDDAGIWADDLELLDFLLLSGVWNDAGAWRDDEILGA